MSTGTGRPPPGRVPSDEGTSRDGPRTGYLPNRVPPERGYLPEPTIAEATHWLGTKGDPPLERMKRGLPRCLRRH